MAESIGLSATYRNINKVAKRCSFILTECCKELYNSNMKQQRRRKNPELIKGIVVGVKLTSALVDVIDVDAERCGLSRSDIIRRTLLDAFRHKIPTQVA
jgi:hypothetical protein